MESADNLYTSLDFSRRLEPAEAFVASRDDFGKVLVQAERADLLEEGIEAGGGDGSSQASDEGRVLFEGRIE